MQKPASASPSIIPAILALLLLLGIGYFIYSDLEPSSRTEHTLNPPIEIIDPEPAITVIESEPEVPEGQEIVEQEATDFVANLTPESTTNDVVSVTDEKGAFIRYDGKIVLPNLESRDTSVNDLLNDSTLNADTPVTVEYTEKKHVSTTLATLKEQIEDHTAPITIKTAQGEIITAPLADLLAHQQIAIDETIVLIESQMHSVDTTIAELNTLNLDNSQTINATINHGEQTLSINKIIESDGDIPDNAIFYLHRVTENDQQGLWGIIQAGLIDKFRQGISLEGISRNKDVVQVTIPADADEKLNDGLSSFLGKVLNNKVTSSYVYNYKTNTMGYDPNVIHPGQQLILIHFSEQELKDVYQFFSDQRNQNAESFAVSS